MLQGPPPKVPGLEMPVYKAAGPSVQAQQRAAVAKLTDQQVRAMRENEALTPERNRPPIHAMKTPPYCPAIDRLDTADQVLYWNHLNQSAKYELVERIRALEDKLEELEHEARTRPPPKPAQAQGELLADYDIREEGAAQILGGHASGAGELLAIMDAKQTLHMWLFMISRAAEYLVMTCFTLDLPEVVACLITAQARGVQGSLFVDKSHTQSGVTNAQPERLKQLLNAGVDVRFLSGIASGGNQHSKTLCVDGKFLIVGSTNWTKASQRNIETSVLIRLSHEGRDAERRRADKNRRRSESITRADLTLAEARRQTRSLSRSAREVPKRAISASPSQHKTAHSWRLSNEQRGRVDANVETDPSTGVFVQSRAVARSGWHDIDS